MKRVTSKYPFEARGGAPMKWSPHTVPDVLGPLGRYWTAEDRFEVSAVCVATIPSPDYRYELTDRGRVVGELHSSPRAARAGASA